MAYNVVHLHIAQEDIINLKKYFSPKHYGFYYLGSIFPDSYIFIGPNSQMRSQFHFNQKKSDLFFPVKRLYKAFNWDFTKAEHRAFYLGYVCHLLTDKIYGRLIYYPYFSNQTFSNPTLYFDIFRYYHNSLYTKVYKSKKIQNHIKEVNNNSLSKLFPSKHIKFWKQINLNQLQKMSSPSAYFAEFIGDKNRYQQASDSYSKLIPEILKVIDADTIHQTENFTQNFLSLTRSEIFNPKSVIKFEDII